MELYRYPGLRTFTSNENQIYRGRNSDIKKLAQLLSIKQLLILYSRSGLGKSSLLTAGVKPFLELAKPETDDFIWDEAEGIQNTRCDIITLHAYSSPTQNVLLNLFNEFSTISKDPFYIKLREVTGDCFWSVLKTLRRKPQSTGFLLVFDQFEQLFSYGTEIINDFRKQLAELLSPYLTQSFKAYLKSSTPSPFTESEIDFLSHPTPVKIVISVRSDRLYYLHRFKDILPDLSQNSYEIMPLNANQAREAIVVPANMEDTEELKFKTKRFSYEEDAITKIIEFLSSKHDTDDYDAIGGIDPGILQIICRHIELKIVEAKKNSSISVEDLVTSVQHLGGDMDAIIQNYYIDSLNELNLPNTELNKLKVVIENKMIREGRRIPILKTQAIEDEKIDSKILEALVDKRLFRNFQHESGVQMMELTHDTLVEPILKSKHEREKEEFKNIEQQNQIKEAESLVNKHYKALAGNEMEDARKFLEQALDIYQKYADINGITETKISLSNLLVAQGNRSEAASILESALQLAEEKKQNRLIGRLTESRALVLTDEEKKHEQYEEAFVIYKKIPDHNEISRLGEQLGSFYEYVYEKSGKQKEDALFKSFAYTKDAYNSYNLLGQLLGKERMKTALERVERQIKPWGFLVELFTGEVYPLKGINPVRVGRDVYNEETKTYWLKNEIGFPKKHRFMSRRHLTIDPNLNIEDNQSTNGTTINSYPLIYGDPRKLKDGDIIVLGGFTPLQFFLEKPQRVAVPANCWGAVVRGLDRKVFYLALDKESYSVLLKSMVNPVSDFQFDLQIESKEMEDAIIQIRLSENVPEIYLREKIVVLSEEEEDGEKKNVMGVWQTITVQKDPSDRMYKAFLYPHNEWQKGINFPIYSNLKAVQTEKEKESSLSRSAFFQFIYKEEYEPD